MLLTNSYNFSMGWHVLLTINHSIFVLIRITIQVWEFLTDFFYHFRNSSANNMNVAGSSALTQVCAL